MKKMETAINLLPPQKDHAQRGLLIHPSGRSGQIVSQNAISNFPALQTKWYWHLY